MKAARKKPTAAKLRSWRVIIMRSKGEHIGTVEAPDRERAEAAAMPHRRLTSLRLMQCATAICQF